MNRPMTAFGRLTLIVGVGIGERECRNSRNVRRPRTLHGP